jgi:hypothetical protein
MRSLLLGLLVIPVFSHAAQCTARSGPGTAALVELYTSEGCSSCPPADTLLDRLVSSPPAGGAEIIGLGQHVDYWDQLGWKDRFSSAALTSRQRLYAARFNNESIYTPQMVVDGTAQLVGSDENAARRAIERALASPHGVVRVRVDNVARGVRPQDHGSEPRSLQVTVSVSDLPAESGDDRADILVAVTEDHLRSDVKRGENHGRILTHAAVVRHMVTIGQASMHGTSSARAEIPLSADWQRDRLRLVAFVQEQRGRAILASAAVALTIDGR